MARAVKRDAIAGFNLTDMHRSYISCGAVGLAGRGDPARRMAGNGGAWRSRAVSTECRGRESIFRRRRCETVVSCTLAAAEQKPLLRGLAERWGNQRQGENEQQKNGEDAAHLSTTIPQRRPHFQKNTRWKLNRLIPRGRTSRSLCRSDSAQRCSGLSPLRLASGFRPCRKSRSRRSR